MAYKFTVANLKQSTIKTIAGVCLDSQEFLDVVNEVQRRLLRRGNWFDTEWLIRICVDNGCVTWPRYVGTVLGAKLCDGGISSPKNKWYSIIGGARSLNSPIYGFDLIMKDGNTQPTYKLVIPGDSGKIIRYYVVKREDIGKTLTIYGTRIGGQPLQHKNDDDEWVDGVVITTEIQLDGSGYGIAEDESGNPIYVASISAVVREATQGMSYLYEYDATADTLRDLAVYEPNETNPRYRTSKLENFCCAPSCQVTTTVSGTDYVTNQVNIDALIKLQHFDVTNENDFLLIDNFEAFKFGFQAVKLEEANDDKSAEVKMMKAIRELNFDDRDKNPSAQTAVAVSVAGSCPVYSPY